MLQQKCDLGIQLIVTFLFSLVAQVTVYIDCTTAEPITF